MSQTCGASPKRTGSRYCTPWMVSLVVQCTYAADGVSFTSSGRQTRVCAQSFVEPATWTWLPAMAAHLPASLNAFEPHAPVTT